MADGWMDRPPVHVSHAQQRQLRDLLHGSQHLWQLAFRRAVRLVCRQRRHAERIERRRRERTDAGEMAKWCGPHSVGLSMRAVDAAVPNRLQTPKTKAIVFGSSTQGRQPTSGTDQRI
jgi:hypothetical protein